MHRSEQPETSPWLSRDPLAARLIGSGKPFELDEAIVAGHRQQIFQGRACTLADLYRDAAANRSRPLIAEAGQVQSFDEVFAKAALLKTALQDRYGVTRGTTVGLAMSNRPEFVVAVIAITAAGGIVALINSRGVGVELLRAIATADCRVAILDAERAAIVAADVPDPAFDRIIVGASAGDLREGRDADFATLVRDPAGAALDPVDVAPEDGAVILFTSGTTGFPKGALLSHRAITHAVSLSILIGMVQDLRWEEENGETLDDDRRSMTSPAVILPPMFHLSGMLPIFRSIAAGATIHILGKWNVDVAFDMIEQTGMSRLSMVPTMLWDMFRSPRATPAMLERIRFMVNGGGPLDPLLVGEIMERVPKCLMVNTYGQTENTAWACSISGRPYLDHPASCGWSVPTVRVSIRREDGSAADVGEAGEIWTSSAATMTGYYSDAAATEAALVDGWLATGDIGTVDADGLFTVVDRKKNMVISGGENIYCAEVERVLAEHPAVLESIAYGMPDARLGERLVADIVTVAGVAVGEDDLKTHCRCHLALYKVPREMTLRTTPLLRTGSGKIDRGPYLARRPT